MAGSVNKVILVGNLGKDPEVRKTNNGNSVVSFSIATSETWKDKRSGERQEKTQWHNIVIWNERLGEVAEQYLAKGDKVYIEGALETRKYEDKDGNDRYVTEIVLQQFRGELHILSNKNGGNGKDDEDDDRSSRRSTRSRDDDEEDRPSRRTPAAASRRSNGGEDEDRSSRRTAARSNGDDRGARASRRDDPPRNKRGEIDDEIPF